jgi:hypothetical protein
VVPTINNQYTMENHGKHKEEKKEGLLDGAWTIEFFGSSAKM